MNQSRYKCTNTEAHQWLLQINTGSQIRTHSVIALKLFWLHTSITVVHKPALNSHWLTSTQTHTRRKVIRMLKLAGNVWLLHIASQQRGTLHVWVPIFTIGLVVYTDYNKCFISSGLFNGSDEMLITHLVWNVHVAGRLKFHSLDKEVDQSKCDILYLIQTHAFVIRYSPALFLEYQ